MANNPLTISGLNKYIQHIIKQDPHLKNVEVVGEVSNFTPHRSNHMYFTLKDDESRIDSIMFASNAVKIDMPIKNGDKVVVKGYVDVYPPTGKYQLYATSIKLDGIGDLTRKYEVLKTKLKDEGLFDIDKKKPIPVYPKRIGIITATSGAAIRDMLSTIDRRYRLAEVVIFSTIVQGEYGAGSIINSLNLAEQYDLDVVIIGRGGGSIEDLWNFNEESVVRRLAEFKVPLISGVGHETDTTLCDYVCDLRAETPTAAAVAATPDTNEVLRKFENVNELLKNKLKHNINSHQKEVVAYNESYFKNRLNNKLNYLKINCNKYDENYFNNKLNMNLMKHQNIYVNEYKRLEDSLLRKLNYYTNDIQKYDKSYFTNKLNMSLLKNKNVYVNEYKRLEDSLVRKLNYYTNDIIRYDEAYFNKKFSIHLAKSKNKYFNNNRMLINTFEKYVKKESYLFQKELMALTHLDPMKILSRGYSVSYSDNKLVKSVNDVKDNIRVILSDGHVDIDIKRKEVKTNE